MDNVLADQTTAYCALRCLNYRVAPTVISFDQSVSFQSIN